MRGISWFISGLVCCLALGLAGGAVAENACFLHDGDVWVFHGDSITNADTYRQLCARVFQHYHPEAKVEFLQEGVAGSTSSDLMKRLHSEGRKVSVASLMLGMNNAINSAWVKGMPREAYLAGYRKDLTDFVRNYQASGAAVILMSPTLADETSRRTIFRLEGGNDFLHDCQRVVKEVAAAEGAVYLPVQEEFEAFQATIGPEQKLRADGVHPASLGEYQIARTLWQRLNFAGPLTTGPRTLSEPAPALPVALRLTSRFLAPEAQGIAFTPAPTDHEKLPAKIIAAWSLGEQRGTAEIDTPTNTWTLPLPKGLPIAKSGEAATAVITLRAGEQSAVCVLDLAAVTVLHFKDNVITGAVDSATDRPAGKRVASWTLTRTGGALLLDVDVTDNAIVSKADWPWGRDGLNLFWDLRPTERFADINFDTDVHQTLVNVYEQPFFAAALRPWMGVGMEQAATAAGERTATGYRVRFLLHQNFSLHSPLNLAQRDYIGLAVGISDAGPGGLNIYESTPPQHPHDQYANNLPIIDLKNTLHSDVVVNAHVFGPGEN